VRRARIVGAAALFMLLLVAGCTGGGHGKAGPAAVAETLSGSGAFQPNRQGPAPPIAGAVSGGTVTVLDPFAAPTLDPSNAYNADAVSVLSGLVTRSLTQYVYDPARKSMVLVPDLATDLGRPNKDFTRWSFTIRDGVRFENGRKVTAADVAFGIERSLDRPDFPQGPPYSTEYFLDGRSYQGPYQSGTSYPGVAVAGTTVTITMAHPFPDMPYWAASPAMGPIPQFGSEPRTYGKHPLATGPYKVAASSPKSLTLVRNAQWDPRTDPGRHAYPDRYVFHFHPEQDVDVNKVDAPILGESSKGRTALAFYPWSDGLVEGERLHRASVAARPCTYMVEPDYRKVRDIRVREAIGFAYPYLTMERLSGDLPGVTALQATSMFPPGFPGRRDYTILGKAPGTTDPKLSRALLEQSGYSPGQYTLTWPYDRSDPNAVRQMHALARAFEVAGFTAKPFATASSDALSRVTADANAPVNLRIAGWCYDWPSGASWFPGLFGRPSAHRFYGDQGNLAFFREPRVDKEMQRTSRLPVVEQPDAWGALGTIIMTKYYPVIPTKYEVAGVLHGSMIGGAAVDNIFSMPTWKDIHVLR
jgi:peptide/nickel transport system substrate-binding protein